MATDLAVSTGFGSLSTYVFPGGYDQTKLGLGPCMVQANDAGNEGKWVGPIPTQVMRPVETSAAAPVTCVDAVTWSTTYDWVIFGDNASVAVTRRFSLYTFNKTVRTNPWAFCGFITATFPTQGTAGTFTHKGHRISYEKYITGTVYISNGSPTLNGVGSAWSADRIFAGCRVGIGSIDPTAITTWYEISSVGGDGTITLTQNYAGTTILVGGAVPYVIEDLRILAIELNGVTAVNTGLFMVAGIRFENFTNAGTTISAATNVDKIRAVYWLNDGNNTSNATNQAVGGVAIDTRVDWTHQNVYVCDMAASSSRFQINNFRAAMTLTNGRDSNSAGTWILTTGSQAVTGTVAPTHNLVLCTPGAGGGPRSGVKSLFWVTTTRIYSAAAINITSGSTYFQSGCAVEAPPGTTTTYAVTGTLNSIAYDSVSDRFLVLSSGASANRCYWTLYREDVGQWERLVLTDTRQLNQSTEDPTAAIVPTTLSLVVTADCVGGMTYMHTTGTTAITNWIFNCPFGADWEYASTSNCCVVTPVMSCSQFTAFVAAYANVIEVVGGPSAPTLGRTGTNLGVEPGAVRLYYRTSGISDNTGTWNLLDYSGNMTSVATASQIQARIEYRIINSAFPARVTRVCFEGTGAASINNFQFSQGLTVLANKQFAFRQAVALGANTTLYMRIYDAVLQHIGKRQYGISNRGMEILHK
jgi:hypothetical protein